MASFDAPIFADLLARVRTDIDSRTGGSPFFPLSIEQIIAFVLAKVSASNHAHAAHILEEILPTTCSRERLLQWAEALGLTVQLATFAVRIATFTGSGTPTIPVDTAMQLEDGTTYTVTTGGTMAGGTVDVTVTANVSGTGGNVAPGAVISLVSSIAGVNTDGVVADDPGNVDAVDVEATEDLRARVLQRLQFAPSGGGPGDYEAWALEVEGVTRAWEFGNRVGVGTVSLGFVRDSDTDGGGEPDIIPSAGEVTEVQDYIDSVRPIDMREAFVVAPVARPVDMTIALSPNTTAVQDAVKDQLTDLFRIEAGLEVAGPVASKISEAISTAAGEDDHEIVSIDGGSLSTFDPAPGDWAINTLGDVAFQELS